MKTFSELLTEYMYRTGISDSELARTLGVRRQTIFRWKEGLVERPRRREDVLLCAQKLRLSPGERDGLLLAAGFSPETLVPEPAATVQLVSQNTSARKNSRRVFGIFAACALVASLAVLAFAILRDYTSYPAAASGETLVVISPFIGPTSLATATPNSRAPLQPSDINTRLQAAFEREIAGARLERVRVAVLPQPVRDLRQAEDARQRSRATILLWGDFENNLLRVNLSTGELAARADDLPLDALVLAPNGMQMKISPDEVQSLALVALAQIYLDRGEYDLAHTFATQALVHPPNDSESLATLFANLGYVNQISKPPDLNEAIEWHSQAISLAPNAFSPYLNRGIAYLRQNKSTAWQSDLNRAVALDAIDVTVNRALCWAYVLDKEPEHARTYCDAGVNRDATARSREARAIAFAEMGRLTEAAEDLQIFLTWLASQPISLRTRYGSSRTEWLDSLKQGKNPFDDALLNKLRRE